MALLAILVAAAAWTPSGAFAQNTTQGAAERVFSVRDLVVDETAPTIQQAIEQGRAKARLAAAQRLVEKLTLPEDRAAANPALDYAALSRLVISTDFQAEEKRTANRYITTLIMRFNPDEVRSFLESRNVPFVEAQAGSTLLVPAVSRLDAAAWARAWEGRSDPSRLTPFVVSRTAFDRPLQWADVEAETLAQQAGRAVVAEAYSQDGGVYVRLNELRSGAPIAPLAIAGPFQSFAAAQAGAVDALEAAYKKAVVVRTSGMTAMDVTASFSGLAEWVRIRKAMEQSRMIRGLRIVSLSTAGADLSFTYAGRPDQLAADLRARGLDLTGGGGGGAGAWTVRTTAGR